MKPTRFILVDDDALNNTLCRFYIEHALPNMEIIDFIVPEIGFHYLETAFANDVPKPSVLLLDLNMPGMSGWEFLKNYQWLDQKIRAQITIYILTSSENNRDKDFASGNEYVKRYLEKPLSKNIVNELFEESDFENILSG
jgi:CheY-like chemotaxis protein